MFKPLEIVGDTAFRTTDQKVRVSNPSKRTKPGLFSRGPGFLLPKNLSVQQSFVPDLKSKFLLRRSSKRRTKSSCFLLIADKFYLEPEHLVDMDPALDLLSSNCCSMSVTDFHIGLSDLSRAVPRRDFESVFRPRVPEQSVEDLQEA